MPQAHHNTLCSPRRALQHFWERVTCASCAGCAPCTSAQGKQRDMKHGFVAGFRNTRAHRSLEHTDSIKTWKLCADGQGVIANSLEAVRDPREKTAAPLCVVVVEDSTCAPVHCSTRCLPDIQPIHPPNPLAAKTHAKHRHGWVLQDFCTNAKVLRSVWAPRTRRDDDVVKDPLRKKRQESLLFIIANQNWLYTRHRPAHLSQKTARTQPRIS